MLSFEFVKVLGEQNLVLLLLLRQPFLLFLLKLSSDSVQVNLAGLEPFNARAVAWSQCILEAHSI